MLSRQKIATLHGIALHCGYPVLTTKTDRIRAIEETSEFYNSLKSKPLNILSIDVGIKNFSYSKLLYNTVTLPATKLQIHDWNHVNLHDRFGSSAANALTSLLKPYLAKLAVSVVDSILLEKDWVPSLILMESQRTRSNTNSATLPNVLLNYTLEHMIYAAFTARLDAYPSFKDVSIVATNSTKMVNFWINRFVKKETRMTTTFTKKLRAGLLFGWLADALSSPLDLSHLSSRLPEEFPKMSFRQRTAAFLDSFPFETRPGKSDDLIDCLLYNVATYMQLIHHHQLQKLISSDTNPSELLLSWDKAHLNYLAPVVDSFNLELRPEYLH